MSDSPLSADLRVDPTAIEKSLAELWRQSRDTGDEALTRAALWNVVAHASSSELHTQASVVLGRASASVPQRTIIVRADPDAEPEISSWISANCHLMGGGKQVCSEEIAIVAGGDRIHRVPPLVNALLIPDMPVAVWWLGDLPNEHAEYVLALLDPADRLIVDSAQFDSPADLLLVNRVGEKTTTTPADLNWVRLEGWRTATASIFDPPEMRERLKTIRRVRVTAATTASPRFGQTAAALLYAAWIAAQIGHDIEDGSIEYVIDTAQKGKAAGSIDGAEIVFEDGSSATVGCDHDRGILVTAVDGRVSIPASVTVTAPQQTEQLIVRQLKQSRGDRVLRRVLPIGARLAKRVAS